ncbi:ATP-dependent zinc protease [Pseudomonas sp. DTU_2021_1001937_2_SI_NGA_ILE_001]|uniref:retropepsin-like aspartic peptidase RloA2 n=1 Tax=Pseudomonas sp. DTU_2021_1001937_2_SI_NGA_ILE_001 TaxID=3077589 RepID=UPI0025FCFDFD|nr:ATP-dependent zinc protease [Pseudomonas sp. DTU_2021_1001937_2_SI_NGA_ILE_001]WNW12217.1 ATP-dependent zinc protease [Pseudomonas sp. DTU_2021_1001937_2_SI_NGA_ILE_001]
MKKILALLSVLALPALAAEPTLYGRYEYIKVPEVGQTFKAKMDTGALTASLSAKDIELFQRDGEQWVRFRLAAEGASNQVFEHKLARISKIKARAEGDDEDEDKGEIDPAKRPVIELKLCLGKQQRTVEVNLVDRSHFNYPLLIGAKALREFDAAVNPARRYTADKPQCD